jgi:hypothetical protein
MTGLASVELNELGPDQLKVDPAISVAVRFSEFPVHTGELLPSVGAVGIGFMVTVIVAVDKQVPRVAVTV